MTDVTDSYSAEELRTGDVEQFTLSRERMRRMRLALVAEMRSSTPADPRGNRKMLHAALCLLAPDSSLRRKLARCGKRDPVNDLRWFCRRPSCGVCVSRQAKWRCKAHLWPSLQTTPPTQLRWITILTHQLQRILAVAEFSFGRASAGSALASGGACSSALASSEGLGPSGVGTAAATSPLVVVCAATLGLGRAPGDLPRLPRATRPSAIRRLSD